MIDSTRALGSVRAGALAVVAAAAVGAAVWTAATQRQPRPETQPVETPAPAAPPLFVDVTAESGIDFVHDNGADGEYRLWEIMSGGGGFLDYDGDGDLDIFLVQSGRFDRPDPSVTCRLFRNDGEGRFTDATAESGAGVGGYGMGCAAADHDRDGDVDLYITRVGRDVLLVNNGDGTFSDGTREAGLGGDGYSSSAAFLDYDRDGWLDLYVTRYIRWTPADERVCTDVSGRRDYCNPTAYPPAGDLLYRNLGGGRFEDVTAAAGIGAETGYGLALLCSDFDGDGWIDVYVANDQSPAFLWRNRSDGTFREEGMFAGCAFNGMGEAIAGMGTAAEDFDGDGDLDLFVTNIRDRDNLFLRNDGATFEDVGYSWSRGGWVRPYTGFGVTALDADLDGTLELFVTNGAVNRIPAPPDATRLYAEPNQLLRRDAAGRFESAPGAMEMLLAPSVSRGLAWGDYDDDGDVDLLVLRNRDRPQLLRNDQRSGNHWLIVATEDELGLGPVLNARISVEAAGRRRLREARGQQSYLATGDPRVHFGLGGADRIERLTIRWPDGRHEQWPGMAADRVVTIRQGTGTPVEAP